MARKRSKYLVPVTIAAGLAVSAPLLVEGVKEVFSGPEGITIESPRTAPERAHPELIGRCAAEAAIDSFIPVDRTTDGRSVFALTGISKSDILADPCVRVHTLASAGENVARIALQGVEGPQQFVIDCLNARNATMNVTVIEQTGSSAAGTVSLTTKAVGNVQVLETPWVHTC